MPIPQLSRKVKSGQSWRNRKKKYYVPRRSKATHKRRGSKPRKRSFRKVEYNLSEKFIKLIVLAGIILFISGSLFGIIIFFWLSKDLPPPGRLIERQVAQSTKILDRTGETILYEIHGEEKRTLVNLEDIPEHLKWATIVIEDKDFYKHKGFSLWAIFRTTITNVLRGQKAGGSTLTQQFIKNAVLTSEKKYARKIKELILAYRMEKKYSKDEILQMYLNEIPYGSTAYGVEAASQRYFGKSVEKINLAEAAILAALPQAPSRYSPYGSNKDLLFSRQHYILDLMVKYGYVSKEEAQVAKGVQLKFKEPTTNIIAPHFVMYVKEMLAEKYGEKMIEQEGLKIYTTLDLYKQKIAEEAIAEIAPKNEEDYQAMNAALISLDPKTGQVLAMVGSRDYFNDEIDGQVNITTSLRQPGSSLKPLVYASAFIKGYTPDAVLYDVVTNFSNDPDKPYEPHNYDDEEHGPVTIRKALAGSLNIPAVKTIYLSGIDNVLDLAEELGYTSFKDRSRFGLSLVLGGGEVKLIEHTNAYSTFAREGLIHPIISVLKIEDRDGKVIEEAKDSKGKRVLDAKIARLVNDILSDNIARAFAFGERNWLTLGPRPVAAKTGTTNDYRDAWAIGYTPSIVTGVWVGNNDNSPMKRGAAGGTVAAPIWHNYMLKVLGDTPIEYFKKEEIIKTGKPVLDGETSGEIKVKIDKASGLLATEHTPESFIKEEIFAQAHCILYYVNKDDPQGDSPKEPGKDSQFELWESRVQNWADEQGFSSSTPPVEFDNLHRPENLPTFSVITPANNQTIMEPFLIASIDGSAPRGINRAEYYIDNNLLFVNKYYPFNLEKQIGFLPNGFHNLKIRVCDDVDNCSEKSLDFNLIIDELQETNEISFSWISPATGLAVTNVDFPLEFRASVTDPNYIAKIDFYYLAEENNQPELITSLAPVEADLVSMHWEDIPFSGTYKVYTEVHGWNNQIKKSNGINITVNNIEDVLNN